MANEANKSGGARTAKWDLKHDPSRIKDITTQGKPTYLANASTFNDSIYSTELAVKQVLNSEGMGVTSYPFYLDFGREMWSKCRKFAGEALAKEAAILVTKWKDRGYSQAVLEAIRTQVFNVSAPTP